MNTCRAAVGIGNKSNCTPRLSTDIMYPSDKFKQVQPIVIDGRNYNITQVNGQRIYGLRHKHFQETPRNSELFIGRLPRDMFENELVSLFSQIGPIFELRLMVDFKGNNRGYCFIRYFTRETAWLAIHRFNHHEIRPGCKLGVYWSLDNTRLFVGGIPKDKTAREIKEQLENFIDDIKEIILYPSHDNRFQNRGYVFLEFENHRAAAIARRRIPPGSILWDTTIKVDWADPLPEPDPEIMSRVATLYLRNLPIRLNRHLLKCKLGEVVRPSLIEKVHKSLDYAFVHFISREAAEMSLKLLQNLIIHNQPIEVSWARPQLFSKKYTLNVTPQHYCMSLPARSRWLIKMKSLRKQANNDLTSEDSGTDSPLFVFPRDLHILQEMRDQLFESPNSFVSNDYL